jgi:amino acid adenylation domain-containing protein
MLLHEPLLATARRLPEKTALVDKNQRLSYGALADAVERFAAGLAARGVRRGDRVAVFLPNVAEAAVAMYGALRAGAVFMPVNPLTRADKLALLLADAEAAALVTTPALASVWSAALAGPTSHAVRFVVSVGQEAAGPTATPVIPWDHFLTEAQLPASEAGVIDADLAALIYTSGSTGEPKGVMLTHLNILTVAASVTSYLGLEERDVLFCVLPLSFSYGVLQLTAGFPAGATVVLETSFAFPAKSLATMQAERVTCFAGVPTMYALLLGLPNLGDFDLGALRLLTNAADALPEPVLAGLRRAFPAARVFSMYGLTECQRVSYLPPEELDRRPSSVGRGMPNQELWLVDPDDPEGKRLPLGATGELVVRGSHVMRGYWRKPAATAQRLGPGPLPGESVLRTGDIFRTDADGFFYFVARKDDIIKSRGEKVSPREVESAIHALAGVASVAVVGVADAMLGHAIKAFVVRRDGATISERDVMRHCRERLESYMVPHEVAFVTELPTTVTGKVRRADLRRSND